MTLSPGARLGPYEITASIGAGGMGEVFRARDTKLNREVAIKVLPPALAQDTERVGRFRREAQILATLNHPNIAAIYGLEETAAAGPGQSAVVALVMELVGGEDLAERLRRGAIPVETTGDLQPCLDDRGRRADRNGVFAIWKYDLARNVDFLVSGSSFVAPIWSRDGRSIIAAQRHRGILRLDAFAFRPAQTLFKAPRLGLANFGFHVTPDGQRFVAVIGGDPDPTPLTLVIRAAVK
jgi:hypothetical protein